MVLRPQPTSIPDHTSQESYAAWQVIRRGGRHSAVWIAVIGMAKVGKHSIVDRDIGYAQGSDYVRVFDPTDTGEQEGAAFFRNDHPVDVKWFTLALNLYNSPHGSEHVEAQIQQGRRLIRQCDACVLVYSCAARGTFDDLTGIWNELYFGQQRATPDIGLCKHIWVVANKTDLPRADWAVSLLEGDDFSSTIGADFRQMSTRTGEGTEGFGREVANCVLAGRKNADITSTYH